MHRSLSQWPLASLWILFSFTTIEPKVSKHQHITTIEPEVRKLTLNKTRKAQHFSPSPQSPFFFLNISFTFSSYVLHNKIKKLNIKYNLQQPPTLSPSLESFFLLSALFLYIFPKCVNYLAFSRRRVLSFGKKDNVIWASILVW